MDRAAAVQQGNAGPRILSRDGALLRLGQSRAGAERTLGGGSGINHEVT